MKTLQKIFTILLAAFTLISCESWLDVAPSSQIKESDQFSSEQGFKDALYGVYTSATDTLLYADHLTYGLLSAMSSSYSNITANIYGRYQYALQFDYERDDVEKYFKDIWNASYNTIAHINLILKNIDKQKSIMSEDVYNVIKGEMIGMRAYIHFDLLRMFVPAYSQAGDLDILSIPFQEVYGVKAEKPLTMKKFAEKIIHEIGLAKGYLEGYKEIDQLGTVSGVSMTDDFMMYRQNRFNYYAVKGLEARALLWFGRGSEAAAAAREVIESGKFFFAGSDQAVNAGIITANNSVFTSELIFALYYSNFQYRSDKRFTETIPSNNANDNIYLQTNVTYQNSFYEVNSGGSSDLRYVNQFGSSGTGNYCKKYWQLTSMPMSIRYQLPLIRLGEMYLIAGEGDSDPVIVNELKSARAIPETAMAGNLQDEIRKEYIKDLYAEGQIWFYYKRMNIARFPNATKDAIYTFPIPEDELIYGEY